MEYGQPVVLDETNFNTKKLITYKKRSASSTYRVSAQRMEKHDMKGESLFTKKKTK